MSWEAYEEAFVHTPEAHRILGRSVRPFSYYHLFWLRLIGSPLLTGEATTLMDLEIAVRICRADYGQVEKRLRWWKRWARWDLSWWWRLWRTLRGRALKGEVEAFQDYIADYYALPELDHAHLQRQGGGPRPPDMELEKMKEAGLELKTGEDEESLPDSLAAVAWLIETTHWPEKTCWMMPIGKLHWYVAAIRRVRGDEIKFLTERDRRFRELVTELKAQAEARKDASDEKGFD